VLGGRGGGYGDDGRALKHSKLPHPQLFLRLTFPLQRNNHPHSLDFQACLDGDTTTVNFTPVELNGTSQEFIESHPRDAADTSKVVLTVKYPGAFGMDGCRDGWI